MKPDDIGPMIPLEWAVRAKAVSLAAKVRIDYGSFVRGDMAVSERDSERLLGLAPGTLRKRRETGICGYNPKRESNRYWYSLFEIAHTMIHGD
jgi:hypothetical protein